MSQTPIPYAWTLESGLGPCLTSRSLGKIFISESYQMTGTAQPPFPSCPALQPCAGATAYFWKLIPEQSLESLDKGWPSCLENCDRQPWAGVGGGGGLGLGGFRKTCRESGWAESQSVVQSQGEEPPHPVLGEGGPSLIYL